MTPANPRHFRNSFDAPYFVPTCDQFPISDQYTQTIMVESTFQVHEIRNWFARSNFRADISPAHIVCTRQEEDLAISSVSYGIAYLNSFRCGSPICSVSTIPFLRHAIRHSFSFPPAQPFVWLHFLHITKITIHGASQNSSYKTSICVYKPFIVDHCIKLRNTTGNCKRQIAHQSNAVYYARIYVF